jgi:hypothetical protein
LVGRELDDEGTTNRAFGAECFAHIAVGANVWSHNDRFVMHQLDGLHRAQRDTVAAAIAQFKVNVGDEPATAGLHFALHHAQRIGKSRHHHYDISHTWIFD